MLNASFRSLPFMGVIRVNEKAARLGFTHGDPDWINLGQGQPEVGALSGAPPRVRHLEIETHDHAYGPVEGLPELREAVAAHYNRLYRKGKASQYTVENVMISPGGRSGLTRCGAALGTTRLGHFTPDYTAYEDLLRTFEQVRTRRIELTADEGFRIEPSRLGKIIDADRLDTLIASNPCNPTGVVVRGDQLHAWIEIARRSSCTLILDEYYSHYVYSPDGGAPVSAAAFVEDVERDPIVIVDGLTKCFRYPGWRVGWIVAPREIIETMTAAGSFLDGGPSRPIQRAAIDVLEPARADQECDAVRKVFAAKQRLAVERLGAMGVRFPQEPQGTFYAFGSIEDLPGPLDDGERFMDAGFGVRVLTVPGAYFDVDPRRERRGPSAVAGYVRFSFGSPRDAVVTGLDRLAAMVAEARTATMQAV